MDITQLKYFITVCQFNHMTLAADQLFISQSALSKHINQLEEEIGVKLFDRTGRNIHLTTAGQDFLEFAQDVVTRHNHVLQKIHTYLQQKNHLALGAIPILSQYNVHQAILAFEKEQPDISLQIFEDKGDQILKLLDDELVELAIVRTATLPNDSYKSMPFAEDELVLVVSAQHPLAQKNTPICLKELSNENFFMLDTGDGLHDLCLTACQRAGFKPVILHQFTRIETILGFVRENAGVTLLMKKVLQSFPNDGLCCLTVKDHVRSQVALVFPHGRRLSPSAILFQLFLMKFFKNQAF